MKESRVLKYGGGARADIGPPRTEVREKRFRGSISSGERLLEGASLISLGVGVLISTNEWLM